MTTTEEEEWGAVAKKKMIDDRAKGVCQLKISKIELASRS